MSMSPDEKEQLVGLLQDARHWCQGAEARDAEGHDVVYSDADATAWDLTGAACRLFGWRRARELFVQIDRHLHGGDANPTPTDSGIAAMVALQTWNDDVQTTHAELVARLQSLPVCGVRDSEPRQPMGDTVGERTQR
jgi:hypothetical protein